MLFHKLFRLLVVSGAMIGGASGCAAKAETKPASENKIADGGTAADGGTTADVAPRADGGTSSSEGGGSAGW